MRITIVCLIIALHFASVPSSRAQRTTVCGTQEHLMEQIRNNPSIAHMMARYEQRLAAVKDGPGVQSETVYTIPLVFHVLYHRADQNVSDERIQEQVAVLNRDFAGQNANTMGAFSPTLKADLKIQFCLAKTAPDGSSTTGIERRQTPIENFANYHSNIKRYAAGGMDAWDPQVYFNVWVCATDGLSFGVFPGSGINDQYGAVVHHDWITGGDGRHNNGGAITVHEVGHCLNLRHIWGDDQGACTGSDLVDDTPSSADNSQPLWTDTQEDLGKVITDSCTSSSPGIMYTNFMDYGYNYTYANFTPGQKTRARVNLSTDGALYNLSQSTAGNSPSSCTPPTGLTSKNIGKSGATLTWTAMQNAQSYNVRYRKQGTTAWTTVNASSNATVLSGLSRTTGYEFQVRTVGTSCTSDYSYIAPFRTVSRDATPITTISAPTLSSPTDASTNQTTSPTLTWNSVSAATEYRCEISTSSSFTDPITLVVASAAPRSVYGLMYGTTYYWRVQARTSDVASAWSDVWSFTVEDGTISTPSGLKPADGTTDAPTTIWLEWTIPSNATGMIVQLSTNADMTEPTEWYRDIRSTQPKGLAYGTTYYWRVKGVTGSQASAWTNVRSFTTADSTLQPPKQSLPGNNSIENPTALNLVWRPEPSATSYAGEYSTSADLSGATTFTTADTATSITGLSGNTIYYWRVRSVNASGSSAWTTTQTFTTVGTSTALDAPVLVSPASASTNVATSPTLSWNSVSNATSYTVQYSTSSSMSPNTETSTSSTSTSLNGLSSNTTYYWRVRATANGYTDSDWSSVWSFKTAKGGRRKDVAGGEEYPLSPGEPSLSIYPVPFETSATLELTLDATTNVRLLIVSSTSGEQIEIYRGVAERGTHEFEVRAATLSSGLYYCKVITPNAVVTAPFSVIR